jgi:CRP-like cAMP-binding protein
MVKGQPAIDKNNFHAALALFRRSIDAFYPLPDSDFEQLSKVLHYKKYNKGELVLQEGKVCRQFWFILKGCFRIYSMETGLEVNVRFFFEQSIAADFISLRHGIPSNFFIVALEETEVLYAYKRDYKPVLNFSKSLIKLTSEFFAQQFFDELEHSNSFKLMSPEERYNSLLLTRPKYFQRIPLTYLASYLGMSRKTLGRIRSNTC